MRTKLCCMLQRMTHLKALKRHWKLRARKGASLVKRTFSAFTPLHGAAFEGRTEIVDLLVQYGATVDVLDWYQNTPLMTACVNNHVDTVRRLIELGARPDLDDGHIAQSLRVEVAENRCSVEESYNLIEVAKKTKLLRCCNPKCGKPSYRKTLKLCGRCKLTRYCSRDCQKQHWSVGHKKCCGHDVYSYEQTDPYERIVMSLTKLALEDE
ncbi:ankyrin repeat and SOCS box protein 11-like [Branchiostoma floridae]|uniref:Ankyrin repeat and SOCS box protein 11-like n=1 Tax=Branchiostoma floridae TaxID=7739 RepID=A0A9J7MUU8_BRAFL|nr:ankyrin repeat and SOCS box protein 11-like [Branchiostoma floridae]